MSIYYVYQFPVILFRFQEDKQTPMGQSEIPMGWSEMPTNLEMGTSERVLAYAILNILGVSTTPLSHVSG